jgi:hypothetical protein
LTRPNIKLVDRIQDFVSAKFDKIALRFLGIIPRLSRNKTELRTTRSSLASLFLQALGTRAPNQTEEDALKMCLRIASDYMESLKQKTQAEILVNLNEEFRKKPDAVNVSRIVREGFNKATTHLNVVLNAESNRCVNTANSLKIQKVGASQGVEDPTVFFVVQIDEKNHEATKRLHLMPDGATPRLWKLSQLSQKYFQKDDMVPSVLGTHPYCRCFLSYLPLGYSFAQNGKVTYKEKGWDEYKYQQENFPPPMTAAAFKAKLKREKGKK